MQQVRFIHYIGINIIYSFSLRRLCPSLPVSLPHVWYHIVLLLFSFVVVIQTFQLLLDVIVDKNW